MRHASFYHCMQPPTHSKDMKSYLDSISDFTEYNHAERCWLIIITDNIHISPALLSWWTYKSTCTYFHDNRCTCRCFNDNTDAHADVSMTTTDEQWLLQTGSTMQITNQRMNRSISNQNAHVNDSLNDKLSTEYQQFTDRHKYYTLYKVELPAW